MKQLITLIILVFGLAACGGRQSRPVGMSEAGAKLSVDYADGFSIEKSEHYLTVTVFNPWEKGKVYARYFLVKDERTSLPSEGIKVKVPLGSLGVASVTHLEFLNLLGQLGTVTGICSPGLVYNGQVQASIAQGKIADLGEAFRLNVEKTLLLRPEALMMSGYSQTDANAQRVQQAGIPVIYNNEWMETSLLGRAEWIKFVAAFFDRSEQADSIFREIEIRYNRMKAKAAHAAGRPKIMAGNDFRGTWYMPAGRSYMGQLFEDAGGDYFYANDTTTGSLPLNMETVLNNFADADVWLNCNYNSTTELLAADKMYGLFGALKAGRVYNFNKRLLPSSANDFWESAVARPDLVLADVISILHPELLPDWKPVYASQLTP